jgi:hypothetical protein
VTFSSLLTGGARRSAKPVEQAIAGSILARRVRGGAVCFESSSASSYDGGLLGRHYQEMLLIMDTIFEGKGRLARPTIASILLLEAVLLLTAPAHCQSIYDLPADSLPSVLFGDHTVNIFGGGQLPFGLAVINGDLQVNLVGGHLPVLSRNSLGQGPYSMDVQMNSGTIANGFQMAQGDQFFIEGGTVGGDFAVAAGTTLKVDGGLFEPRPVIFGPTDGIAAAMVELRGGYFRGGLELRSGSKIDVFGGDFEVSGVPLPEAGGEMSPFLFDGRDIDSISGVFPDGTPFHIPINGLLTSQVRLHAVAIPVAAPTAFIASRDMLPSGIRRGQSLVVDDGGIVANQFVALRPDFVLVEANGVVGDDFHLIGSQLQTTGGSFGKHATLTKASVDAKGSQFHSLHLNHTNGTLGNVVVVNELRIVDSVIELEEIVAEKLVIEAGSDVTIHSADLGLSLDQLGGELTIEGGKFAAFNYFRGGVVNIRGGDLSPRLGFLSGVQANISGGTFPKGFHANSGSIITLFGDQFAINGRAVVPPSDGSALVIGSVGAGSTITGLLSDGNWFAIADDSFESFANSTFRFVSQPSSSADSAVYRTSLDALPVSLRANQQVIVDSTVTTKPQLNAGIGSHVQIIERGALNGTLEAIGSNVEILGGFAGRVELYESAELDLKAGTVSTVVLRNDALFTMRSGELSSFFEMADDSRAVVEGGTIAKGGAATGRSQVLLRGGRLGGPSAASDAFFAKDSTTVTVEGGEIGGGFQASGKSRLHVLGGKVGSKAVINEGASAEINGGEVEHLTVENGATLEVRNGNHRSFYVGNGSTAQISGGTMETLTLRAGSMTTLSGGEITENFTNADGQFLMTGGQLRTIPLTAADEVVITGGRFDQITQRSHTGTFELHGGEFRRNGVPILDILQPGEGAELLLQPTDRFEGALADGTPFIFSASDGDFVQKVKIVRAAPPTALPMTIDIAVDAAPRSIRGPQALIARAGSVDDFFIAGRDSAVEVRSTGAVGREFDAIAARIDVVGGRVGDYFSALEGSEVFLRGGQIGVGSVIADGSRLHVLAGVVGNGLSVAAGGEVIMDHGALGTETRFDSARIGAGGRLVLQGGEVTGTLRVLSNGIVELAGGGMPRQVDALQLSTVQIFGHSFMLDGKAVEGLELGFPFLVTRRNTLLSGILLDGTPFSTRILANYAGGQIVRIDPQARLELVYAVPEPAAWGTGLILLMLVLRFPAATRATYFARPAIHPSN